MTTVHVEIDLYSGRENPGWKLGEPEAAHFRTRLAGLSPDIADVLSVPDTLGYRGLHVAVNADGVTQRLVIAAGIVIIEAATDDDRRSLRDPVKPWKMAPPHRQGASRSRPLHYLLGE